MFTSGKCAQKQQVAMGIGSNQMVKKALDPKECNTEYIRDHNVSPSMCYENTTLTRSMLRSTGYIVQINNS